MTLRANTTLLLVIAALAGCATPSKPLSEEDVSKGIQLQTGYPSCPACSKVKTYSSPPVVRIATRYANAQATGWINAKVSLVLTNQNKDFIPRYQLVAEFVNSGDFQSRTDLFIGGSKLETVGERQHAQCFSNIGTGCSWVQAYALDAKRIEDAMDSGTGIELFVGKQVQSVSQTNNGYTQQAIRNTALAGESATISSSAIAGFVKGLHAKGVDIPTSANESGERLTKQFEAAARMNAAQEKLDHDRPLKQNKGAQVCQAIGSYTNIGFVEGVANAKVQIRIVDSVVPGTQMHAADFREQIIWDDPDNWILCGNN